jgi:hypothetical protein
MTGRPPRNFVLGLPHGPPRSPPHPPPPTWHLPAWSTGSIGIIGWSTIARRTAAARLGLRLAQERITERLRYALGISYAAWLDWYLLGRGLSEAVVSAGVLGGYEQMAADEIVESLEVLVADGPSATDLRWVKREAAFRTTRPGELRPWMDIIATDHLLEAKTRSTSAWLTEVNGLTRADVRAAFEEMLAISILRTPAEVDLPDSRYVAAPVWAGERPVVGRRFNEPADDKGEADQLIVGDDGVSYVDEDGAGTILFSEAAGLVRREGLPSDLYRLDGKYIDLDNIVEWPRGKAALRAVSEVTPRRLIIDVP